MRPVAREALMRRLKRPAKAVVKNFCAPVLILNDFD
jgi:hypothetical protein